MIAIPAGKAAHMAVRDVVGVAGSAGAAGVAARGGAVVVQDPAEADFASMPRETLAAVPGARSVPTAELALTVLEMLGGPVAASGSPPRDLVWETDLTDEAGPDV